MKAGIYAGLKSWKTTITAFGAALSAVTAAGWALIDGDPDTTPDLNTAFVAVMALFMALQGLFTKDAD